MNPNPRTRPMTKAMKPLRMWALVYKSDNTIRGIVQPDLYMTRGHAREILKAQIERHRRALCRITRVEIREVRKK